MFPFKLGTWTFLLKMFKISSFGRSGTKITLAKLTAHCFWFEMEEEVCDFCESSSDKQLIIPQPSPQSWWFSFLLVESHLGVRKWVLLLRLSHGNGGINQNGFRENYFDLFLLKNRVEWWETKTKTSTPPSTSSWPQIQFFIPNSSTPSLPSNSGCLGMGDCGQAITDGLSMGVMLGCKWFG